MAHGFGSWENHFLSAEDTGPRSKRAKRRQDVSSSAQEGFDQLAISNAIAASEQQQQQPSPQPLRLHSNKNWVTSPSVKVIFMDSSLLSQSLKKVKDNLRALCDDVQNHVWEKKYCKLLWRGEWQHRYALQRLTVGVLRSATSHSVWRLVCASATCRRAQICCCLCV